MKQYESAVADAGVPGYVNQESFRTAREEWAGDEAPSAEEPTEHTPAPEEPTQAPPHTEPATAAQASQRQPQEGGQDEPEQHDEWPDVTLPGKMAFSGCSATPKKRLVSGLCSS